MELLNDESSSTVEQTAASSDSVVDLDETSPKRICISVSNHTVTTCTSVAVAAGCSEMAVESSASELSTQCQVVLSRTPLSSVAVSDNEVSDNYRQGQESSRKASCNEADIECNESFGANSLSDPDVCRRRNFRRKLFA